MIRFFVLLFLTACIGASPAKALNGNQLLISCDSLLQHVKQMGSKDRVQFPPEREMCWFYMDALQNAFMIADEQDRPVLRVCLPSSVTQLHLIRVYVNYARENPAELHKIGAVGAHAAIRKAFPCP